MPHSLAAADARAHMHVCAPVFFCCVKVYNGKVFDLLAEEGPETRAPFRVREHPQLGPYVEGCVFLVLLTGRLSPSASNAAFPVHGQLLYMLVYW